MIQRWKQVMLHEKSPEASHRAQDSSYVFPGIPWYPVYSNSRRTSAGIGARGLNETGSVGAGASDEAGGTGIVVAIKDGRWRCGWWFVDRYMFWHRDVDVLAIRIGVIRITSRWYHLTSPEYTTPPPPLSRPEAWSNRTPGCTRTEKIHMWARGSVSRRWGVQQYGDGRRATVATVRGSRKLLRARISTWLEQSDLYMSDDSHRFVPAALVQPRIS